MSHFTANQSIGTLIKSFTARCHAFTATPSLLRTLATDVSALDNDQRNLNKQLREGTSAQMKDAKASLEACSWDIEAAQRDLWKRGTVIASKKSARTAAEGLLAVAQDDKRVVVVELNCETDFVARNDIFQHLLYTWWLSIRDSIPNLHSIITESDGAMVARGDLGAELPIEVVPLLQVAGIQELHFFPFNPTDKRTTLVYLDAASKMHRVSKGTPE